MQNSITELLSTLLREALGKAGLPVPDDVLWEMPREESHGDYATNVALALARPARKAPREIAEAIRKNFPVSAMVSTLEVAGPGFLNVSLAADWCAGALTEILAAGARYGTTMSAPRSRVLLEFVSANPTGPLVIVNARAAAVGDALARILRSQGLAAAGHTYEQDGALWFRSTAFGDDKDRVLRKSDGELTYFGVDVGFHHFVKFGQSDLVVDLIGPDHHGYVSRIKAAMKALGHPPESFDVLVVQLVTLLRDGEPVRMSKRRGEFVLMEELLEEVGRDAARFTFLTRRHDSPLEFDLALATRQSADNPVYYVQYAHARIMSLFRQAASQGAVPAPEWDRLDWSPSDPPRLTLPEELSLIKRLLQFPDLVAGAAQALEPHRIAYWLGELAGAFHPYYKVNRVIGDEVGLTRARLLLCAAVGQVVRNGLALLGVGAPESM